MPTSMPAGCPGHECRANSQSRSPPEGGRHHTSVRNPGPTLTDARQTFPIVGGFSPFALLDCCEPAPSCLAKGQLHAYHYQSAFSEYVGDYALCTRRCLESLIRSPFPSTSAVMNSRRVRRICSSGGVDGPISSYPSSRRKDELRITGRAVKFLKTQFATCRP